MRISLMLQQFNANQSKAQNVTCYLTRDGQGRRFDLVNYRYRTSEGRRLHGMVRRYKLRRRRERPKKPSRINRPHDQIEYIKRPERYVGMQDMICSILEAWQARTNGSFMSRGDLIQAVDQEVRNYSVQCPSRIVSINVCKLQAEGCVKIHKVEEDELDPVAPDPASLFKTPTVV